MAQGKSPYELRADLLHLSFQILLAQHQAKNANTAPTSEEIIEEAGKLNEFISTQKPSSRN